MRRREFVVGLAGAAAAWPLAARAQQQSRKLPIIGYLGTTTAVSEGENTAVFLRRLHELGWAEGHNIAIEYRWAGASLERADEFAAEFVRLKVDVIHTSGNLYALAAKRATSAIPIVFALAGDPVRTGLVASLARPGGNATGLSNQLIDAARKRIELLREVVPDVHRLAVMTIDSAQAALEIGEIEPAASKFGIETTIYKIRKIEDIAIDFDALKGRADALYVINSVFLAANRMRINTMALAARLPTIFASRGWLEAGGLLSYGTDLKALWRRSADYVDKILRGTTPADIPVEQPTKFDLVVNLITAKALGLTIPETLLATADEIIE
jgi:putative tryptophan/tyrosine transport system substrate-binding protein